MNHQTEILNTMMNTKVSKKYFTEITTHVTVQTFVFHPLEYAPSIASTSPFV